MSWSGKTAHHVLHVTRQLILVFRNFDFPEKAKVDAIYPQYYHKTDKVGMHRTSRHNTSDARSRRMADPSLWNA
jgi:hypothetical protein